MSQKSKHPLAAHDHKGLWVPVAIFSLIAVFTAVDIVADLSAGSTVFHVSIEALLVLTAMVGAIYFLRRLRSARQLARDLKADLKAAQAKTAHWQERESELLRKLRGAIDKQFDEWDLTPTEQEIAFYLLKGLSMKEIAQLRNSTDHSVKQQAYVLYHKAGLKGRAELSAFFLGGLLHLDMQAGEAAEPQEPEELESVV